MLLKEIHPKMAKHLTFIIAYMMYFTCICIRVSALSLWARAQEFLISTHAGKKSPWEARHISVPQDDECELKKNALARDQ